jgi:hypothetical protein
MYMYMYIYKKYAYIRPRGGEEGIYAQKVPIDYIHDDDVYLEYYSAKGFHINYSCLHVLRKTHKLIQ